ncbi:hypothetical protein C8Q76DRAFT_317847 [Earliella scabrosa]|nr:hypothetical protein C8Q76DRAFT_317847 [Earliella scabrosa]
MQVCSKLVNLTLPLGRSSSISPVEIPFKGAFGVSVTTLTLDLFSGLSVNMLDCISIFHQLRIVVLRLHPRRAEDYKLIRMTLSYLPPGLSLQRLHVILAPIRPVPDPLPHQCCAIAGYYHITREDLLRLLWSPTTRRLVGYCRFIKEICLELEEHYTCETISWWKSHVPSLNLERLVSVKIRWCRRCSPNPCQSLDCPASTVRHSSNETLKILDQYDNELRTEVPPFRIKLSQSSNSLQASVEVDCETNHCPRSFWRPGPSRNLKPCARCQRSGLKCSLGVRCSNCRQHRLSCR